MRNEATLKAILARNGFDREAAYAYCQKIAETYGELATEYSAYANYFSKSKGAHA